MSSILRAEFDRRQHFWLAQRCVAFAFQFRREELGDDGQHGFARQFGGQTASLQCGLLRRIASRWATQRSPKEVRFQRQTR